MVTLQATDIPDSVHGLFVTYMTTQCVGRISRVNDDSPLIQNSHGFFNQTRLRVNWVNAEELTHGQLCLVVDNSLF
jgi:hypothetical protein